MSFKKSLLASFLIAVPITFSGMVQAQSLRLLTAPTGSIVHTVGSAISSVASKHTQLTVLAAPMSGPQVFIPQLDSGRAQFALLNAADAHEAFTGGEGYREAYRNLRLVAVGFSNELGVIVQRDSDIRSGEDLKGRRVSGVFSAHKTCEQLATAQMANFGLDWSDVNVVPVTHSRTAVQALGEGRVDAAMCVPLGQAIVQEINAQTPIRFISLKNDPEAVERARKAFPAGELASYEAGDHVGLLDDTHVWSYPFYLAAHKDVPDEHVYAVVKAVSENIDELRGISGVFNRWIPEGMVNATMTIPVHSGAKTYYEERKLWNEAIDKANTVLLQSTR